MAISNWPPQERPRERLISSGAASLTNAELLAICLRSGVNGKSALDLARDLLEDLGSLNRLLTCEIDELCKHFGVGPEKYALFQAAMELCQRQMLENIGSRDILSSSESTRT